MELMPYKEEITRTILVFKEMLDMDFIVVDRWLSSLVNTFHYERKPLDIRINSIVGNIIVTEKPQIISNRQYSKACLTCQDFQHCELEGVAGVPIWSGEECIGVLAVLIRASRIQVLAAHEDRLVAFLEQLANLLAKSAENHGMERQMDESRKQLFVILDSISDLAVFTDEDGRVRFCSQRFCDFFGVTAEEAAGANLRAALEPFSVSSSGSASQVGETFVGVNGKIARLRDVKQVALGDESLSVLYLFEVEDAAEILDAAKPYEAEQKMRNFWGPSKAMHGAESAAKSAIKNNLPVLIEGVCGAQNRELMKIISRYAPETLRSPAIVECSIDAEELRHILFGNTRDRVGLLWPPRKCAVCLASIDHMPLYLQERLFAFMVDRQMSGSSGGKVRLFATSEVNLEELTAKGRFSENLLHLISQNHIVIPDIWEEQQDLEFYFWRFVSEFAAVYGREDIAHDPAFCQELKQRDERMDFLALKELAEQYVIHYQGKTFSNVQLSMLTTPPQEPAPPAAEAQLRLLLEKGHHKSEIAKELGISRATLYRWIKKYNLEHGE